jgi:hypothetical protein
VGSSNPVTVKPLIRACALGEVAVSSQLTIAPEVVLLVHASSWEGVSFVGKWAPAIETPRKANRRMVADKTTLNLILIRMIHLAQLSRLSGDVWGSARDL